MRNRLFLACLTATLLALSLPLSLQGLVAPMPREQTRTGERGLALGSGPVRALPSSAKRFALVIGVDSYADSQVTALGGSVNDAKALAQALVDYAGFPREQVMLLASDQPEERQPTRGNILRRLSNLTSVVPRDGLLLISFAGHGIERGGQAFLLPSDAQVSNDVELLEQTAINVSQVRERIRRIGVGQVLMILDACRNDPTAGRANADNPLTEAYTRGFNFDVRNREVVAFATLYATAVGSRAYEYRERRQGYFTWALVEGLKGGAANERGEVTLGRLVRYLQERVPRQVLLDLGQGRDQRPFAVVEGYRADELVIAVAGQRTSGPPPAETAAASSGNVGAQTSRANEGTPPATQRAEAAGSSASLVGTTWMGATAAGEFEIEFLAGGRLRYTLKATGRSVGGTWRQADNIVHMVINQYSTVEGTIGNGIIRGEGQNSEGQTFRWLLTPKTQ